MPDKLLKIVITGPESTGKSTLSEALAEHYNTIWIPEYAREYLTDFEGDYTFDDVEKMARGQIELEDRIIEENPASSPAFIDTDLLTYRIWFMHRYGRLPGWIETAINTRKYDHYLLCAPDLPWQYDPLRENPELGDYFFEWFKRELEAAGKSYTLISGNADTRFKTAVVAISELG